MIFNGTKELETDRLLLRKIQANDYVVAYKEWCSDEDQVKYTIHGVHSDEQVTKILFDKWIMDYSDPKTLRWMIVLKNTNEQIGTIDVNTSWSNFNCVEVGYIIAKRYWNNGYATEALRAVIGFLFEECGVETIFSQFMEDNVASGKVMEKSGMTFEGKLRNRCQDRTGKRQNLISYSITNSEYYNK